MRCVILVQGVARLWESLRCSVERAARLCRTGNIALLKHAVKGAFAGKCNTSCDTWCCNTTSMQVEVQHWMSVADNLSETRAL